MLADLLVWWELKRQHFDWLRGLAISGRRMP